MQKNKDKGKIIKKISKQKSSTSKVRDPLKGDLSSLAEKGTWVRFSELFELRPKNKTITLRVPEELLKEIKKIAKSEDTDYQKLIRGLISDYISKKSS